MSQLNDILDELRPGEELRLIKNIATPTVTIIGIKSEDNHNAGFSIKLDDMVRSSMDSDLSELMVADAIKSVLKNLRGV
jgi:hypothetical protein